MLAACIHLASGCGTSGGTAPAPVAPTITAPPLGQTVTEGQSATFSVQATGTAPLAYQWTRDGTPIAGATASTYTTPPVDLSADGASFAAAVSNEAGTVTSASAVLTVTPISFSFTATPGSVAPGQASTLVATFSGPAEGLFVGPDGLPVASSGQSIPVVPPATTNYVLYRQHPGNEEALAAVTVTVEGTPTPPFTAAGRLETAREGASVTLLADGTVLVVGGNETVSVQRPSAAAVASAEIYDPATNAFRAANGALAVPRAFHTATVLPDGRVLVAGGAQGASSLASAEIYDPATGRFTLVPPGMNIARAYHRATALDDGRVLVTGGLLEGSSLPGAEIFDPATGRFTSAPGAMLDARCAHESVLLLDGTVLVAGGWSNVASPRSVEAGQPDPVTGLRGYVLRAGEIFDPGAGTFSPVAAPMIYPRYRFASVRLPSGSVALWGTYNSLDAAFPPGVLLEAYDPTSGTFVPLLSGNLDTRFAQGSATLLASGKVLLVMGDAKSGSGWASSAVAYLYDPGRGSLIQAGELIVPRHQLGAALLGSGRVLIVSGVHETHQPIVREYYSLPNVAERFDPANATPLRVEIRPASVRMYTGTTADFVAVPSGTPVLTSVRWTVMEPDGGVVRADGADPNLAHYLAPGAAGTFHLLATSDVDPEGRGTATLTVLAPGSIVVTVSPATVALAANGTTAFTARVDGAVNDGVTWRVAEPNGGVVTAAGVYTAPNAPGTYHVVATSVDDPTRSGVAVVQVN